ncbi:Carboxymuconolactone decarboxylase [Thermincola ferriacetica]|uniref:Carboxymuconolactone decarboxylase n=2 Tax=Thermincola TaxID=278993 RepID=D5XB49_THEPJ|nr:MULTISPECIES: carboxymuconolactone decarboxylase family protein [Thermincola]ADG81369.1 Carboxymuconolactone decarboxylase [Thermincola potens JR]KNZ69149.1 Carboxymuconolactone decarboxylase [Thermincola ferriacetica]
MNVLPFIAAIKDRDEKFYELMKGLQELVYSDSSLDMKTKLMISLAVDAAMGADEGVKSISNILRQMGVTDEQIAEVLRITYFTKANSTLVTSMAAFEK